MVVHSLPLGQFRSGWGEKEHESENAQTNPHQKPVK